jgi:SAM-dependent methyltransferase
MTRPTDDDDDLRGLVARGYDTVAARYAALERPDAAWPRLRWLDAALAAVPAGAAVLDVGCGNGVPVLRALAERQRVTGVDVSPGQAELAAGNVPSAQVLCADVLSLRLPPGAFAAIVALYVVDHVPRERHAELLARFARWLAPGGRVLFTVEPYDEPGTVGQWLGVRMFFSQFDSVTTLALVREAGFEVERHAVERQLEGERGVDYLWILARKRAAATPERSGRRRRSDSS